VTDADEAEDVRRLEFLRLTGVTLASALAPPLVHGWPDQWGQQLPQITDAMLAQLRAQTEGFRWLDRQQGAYFLLPQTARHARALVNLWRRSDGAGPARRALAEMAADACHLVAYQAFDQGERNRAVEWYRCSAELAAQARAKDLYVFAMCGVAYMHARDGDSELAVSVVHQLAALPLSEAAGCYVGVYAAHAHASAGQRDLALRALDRAAASSERSRGDAPATWLGIPDLAFVERQRAMILAGFGSPEALTVLARLETETPAVFQRYQVTLLTDQAQAHARLGHVEQAASLLCAAHQRNARVYSAEKRLRIRQARQVLQPWQTASAVKELDEALRAAPPRPPAGAG